MQKKQTQAAVARARARKKRAIMTDRDRLRDQRDAIIARIAQKTAELKAL
jgi:hypothetical protein